MPPGSALDILVVDDDDALRNMLTRSFEREGHRITSVADGHDALEEAGRGHFDVILLDVALGPGPTGYDIARALRARRNVTPVIMLTALDSEADAVQGLEAGADDYVTKPFGLAELRSRIRAVLRRAHGNLLDDGLLEVGNVVLDQRQRVCERLRQIALADVAHQPVPHHAGERVQRLHRGPRALHRRVDDHRHARLLQLVRHPVRLGPERDADRAAAIVALGHDP